MMLRIFDIVLALVGLILLSPLLFVIYLLGLIDTGSPIFRQERLGRNQQPFILVKFRTMQPDTPSLPSHIVDSAAMTPLGSFLRRTKLDEVPQLWNVLRGEMSMVGPRPCLSNQAELILERNRLGVFLVPPGITGLAQIKGIDMSTPKLLAETDLLMINNCSLKTYLTYILLTALGKGAGDRVIRRP